MNDIAFAELNIIKYKIPAISLKTNGGIYIYIYISFIYIIYLFFIIYIIYNYIII